MWFSVSIPAPDDYIPVSNQLITFDGGANFASVTTRMDNVFEESEMFTAVLTLLDERLPDGIILEPDIATITIMEAQRRLTSGS